MKLTSKQKERNKTYTRKIKLVNELNDLRFKDIKDVKCTKCKKNIEIKKILDCRNKWLTAMNKGKKLGQSDSEFPFGIIPTLFQSGRPLLVCKECQYDIYRFMGKIPDLDSHRVFPHRYTSSISVDKLFEELNSDKPSVYKIHYKGKKYKDSKAKYNELVVVSVKAYIKKYPYVKYSEKQLTKIVKGHDLDEKFTVY